MRGLKKMTKPKPSWTRPPPGYKRFTTYVDEKLLEQLKEYAKAQHKSIAAVVNVAIKGVVKK
jgi:predicted HicB family RNase H-like nuclease